MTHFILPSLNVPVLTSVVTLTEQQTTARNPVPVLPMSEWNLTVILVPVLVKGPGTEVPQ